MTIARHQAWDDTEIAAVTVADLTAAIGLWLARERAGIVLVDEESFATTEQIEARIIAMHDHPAQGLSVLARMRCLVAALSLRRFRHLIRPENAAELAMLVTAAASRRLNARWGMSPLRLAWAVSAAEGAASDAQAA